MEIDKKKNTIIESLKSFFCKVSTFVDISYTSQIKNDKTQDWQKRLIFGFIWGALYLTFVFLGGIAYNIFNLALAILTIFELQSISNKKVGDNINEKNYFKNKSFIILYAFIPYACLIAIRGSFQGFALLMWISLTIWTIDITSYITGKTFGKRKIAPSISPNKTILGSVSGIISGVAISFLFFSLFKTENTNISFTAWLAISLLVSIFSQLGDLFESKIKRVFDVKDSGNAIPGHGGIMDRMDSFTFVAPIVTLLLPILKL